MIRKWLVFVVAACAAAHLSGCFQFSAIPEANQAEPKGAEVTVSLKGAAENATLAVVYFDYTDGETGKTSSFKRFIPLDG